MQGYLGVAAAMLLGACAQGPTLWYTQARADAMPFDEARRMCFERSFGVPAQEAENSLRGGGNRACMRDMGWEDRRQVF